MSGRLSPLRLRGKKQKRLLATASEGGLKDWPFDHVIENNGTVTALYEKVKTILV
jgi:hypothetical protein